MRGIYELETLRDSSGNAVVVTGATVTVRKESDGLIAQIYNAVTAGSLLANPLTIAGSTIQFYAEQNERYRIDITSGTLTRTIRYQSVSIDTVTVKSEAATTSAGQVTAHNADDAAHSMSASGRSVLRGTPAQGRTALELGGSATLDVGVAAGTVCAGNDSRLLTDAQKTDLIDGGESTLHYHASDRARANHTGTQPLSVSTYDNTTSGLLATTGQGAIDEAMSNMSMGVNDIINGQFKIAQTGTEFVSPADGAYDLDGWIRNGVGGTVTISRVAGSVAGSYARESNVTTAKVTLAAGDYELAETQLLGYDCVKYIDEQFVIPLRVKSGITGIHCVSLYNGTSSSSFVYEVNILAADTYQEVLVPVPMGVPALNSSTNAYGFAVRIAQAVGTTFQTATTGAWVTGNFVGTPNQVNGLATVGNKLTIEDVRINLGTVPLPNVTGYDAELARCRRYVRTESLYFRATAQAAGDYTYAVYQIGNEMNSNPTIAVTWASLVNCGTPVVQISDGHMKSYAITSTAAGEFRGFTSAGGLLLTARL